MDIKLEVLTGKNAGQSIPIAGKKFFIGRAEDCHLRPASEMISRHHCAIVVEDAYVGVRDFGSRNGTFINENQVFGEHELKPGDRLKVGPLEFTVHIVHGLGAKKRPPVSDLKEAAARTAASPTKNELDVTSWLEDPAGAPVKSRSTTETQEFQIGDTESIPAVPDGAEQAPHPPHGKKPGRLPATPPANTRDSREAASKALDKFRRRR
jgi:pSer/pThr/pTyr-binding forkhead associated (FHA) protein